MREPYEIGIGYALTPNCPPDKNLNPQGEDVITDAVFEIPTAPDTPPTFISSAQKPQTNQTAKNASKLGSMRVKIYWRPVINEDTQEEIKIREPKLAQPERTKRFAYPLPRELCILWHSEDVSPALIAQHTHDSRYRMPHFPDATELPLSGALAKRLGDRIKMVAEAETESGSEDEDEVTE
ncbi:RNAseH domain-containing protein [Nostoc sp. 'Peltigera malacea cyanobiont' DB3992]|uniref:RNAseH domain-containing protein n=1 Tax=Nostoc sp. 'Peltigera malacea cyanobiont' DB3992 TaxID=1206980 RepID=UPI00211DB61D|nr:RNAseH domain-containing protein [Nostoc sp. 'Peltigera malacea cyanobiont' DB3992]